MSSLTTDNSEVPDADPGAFKDNTSQPSALHSTIERLKTYIYQIGKVSHNVGEETPILGGMARDFCRNVRSLVKPKERYLDEEIISEIITDLVTMLRKIPHKEKFAFSTALAGGLHALAADLHELQTTLALFFGDAPFGADAARKLGDRFADLDGDPRRTVAVATEMIRQSHNSERAKQYDWYQWRTNGIVP